MRFIFKLTIFIFIFFIGIAGLAVYYTFYNQLPNQSAIIKIDGISAEVDIHWDPYGVPYIYSGSDEDLYFTIGYLHAQDRLWQLTLSQLMAEGRFAEYLGNDFLELDIHQRTIGIWNTAKEIEAASSDSLISALQYYSDGVNSYINSNPKRLPIELTLLGLEPPTWTPTHSIAVSRLMAWDQNIHWKSELTLARISEEIGVSRLQQLYPLQRGSLLSDNELNRNTLESLSTNFIDKDFKVREIMQNKGSALGSNAWAVSGSRTANRQPILAGDPHMGLSMPGFWYELHATTPGFTITGATIPGAPFIVLGHNDHLAWSITNMMADDTDFYLVHPNPTDPNEYVADSLNGDPIFERFSWQQEIIQIDGADDYYLRIPHTRQGPVINQIHPDSSTMGLKPVVMKWAGHEVSHELWSFHLMNRAQSYEQFSEALRYFGSPAMNFVYADIDDNIALIGAGNLPVRNNNPTTFLHSWEPNHDWNEWIPFDELPGEINPERGFVANANNKVGDESYPYYIGRFWPPPSRISRINFLLDDDAFVNSETMKRIQNDIFSEQAAEMTEIIIPLVRSAQQGDEFNRALSYLENWDYTYSTNSTAATLFDLLFLNLSELILKRDIPDHLYDSLVRLEYIPVNMVNNILSDGSSFFNIVEEENIRFRNTTVRTAMQKTIEQLSEKFGPEPFDWRWESLHTVTFRPPLLGEIYDHPDSPAALRLIVRNLLSKGPLAAPGHGMTINKGEYSWSDPFDVTLGPSIRRIVDFSSLSRTYSVLPTGQSGHPLSSNYGDQTEMWLDGRYRYIYSDSTFFRETNHRTMKLEPLSIQ